MKRNFVSLAGAVCVIASGTVCAEYYGLPNGRSADLSKLPQTSIEAGAVFGDLFDADYQYLGARFNYKLDPGMMIYGDVGQVDLELGGDADGLAFGGGLWYVLDGVLSTSDLAIRGSYHTVDLEGDGNFEADYSLISVDAVISGRQGIGARQNIGWYVNFGFHRFDFDSAFDDETEIGFGGGFIVPSATGQGEFYAGLELVDEMTFGAGYRFFLQ